MRPSNQLSTVREPLLSFSADKTRLTELGSPEVRDDPVLKAVAQPRHAVGKHLVAGMAVGVGAGAVPLLEALDLGAELADLVVAGGHVAAQRLPAGAQLVSLGLVLFVFGVLLVFLCVGVLVLLLLCVVF